MLVARDDRSNKSILQHSSTSVKQSLVFSSGDVAARGLDIPKVDCIKYDPPDDPN